MQDIEETTKGGKTIKIQNKKVFLRVEIKIKGISSPFL